MHIRFFTSAAIVALATAGSVAQAQVATPPEAAAQAAQQDGGLEEIVVTAQKRAENLQDVPIAVTSLTSAMLESRGAGSVLDLGSAVPGLLYTTNAGGASPRIRGVGTAIASGGNENSVSTYVDGIYYASSPASVLALNNIAQITVLKGPQGTLFGRNATGGLIQITTRDPSEQFSGLAKATYGNHATYGADVYLTGGLADGLAADIAFHYYDQTGGFGKNLLNGQDINTSRAISVRSKWKAQLGSDTQATLIFDYNKADGAYPAFRTVYGAPTFVGPYTGGAFDTNANTQPSTDLEQYGVSLDLRHDFGSVELVSISGYRHSDWAATLDADTQPVFATSVTLNQPDRQFSQELQLVSDSSGPLKWVVGGYYFNNRSGFKDSLIGGPGANFLSFINTRQHTESYALFGQATYSLSDKTSLTGGLRMTWEKKSMTGSGTFSPTYSGPAFPTGPYSASITVKKPTWRLALDHKLTDDVMVYASYNRGFKSGGFDPTSTAVAKSFKPEVLDAYELGIKSELFDRKVRFNAAAFYYDYKDIQLNTFVSGVLSIYNGDSAKIYGADFDLTVVPTSGLTLNGGLSLVHGRYGDFPVTYTKFTAIQVVAIPDVIVNGKVVNNSALGKRTQNTPDYQINLGADYRIPLGSGGAIELAADYFRSGRWFAAPENRLAQEAYSLVNASLAWFSNDKESFSVRFWGRNLFNTVYAVQLASQVPLTDEISVGPGRTFGVTVGTKF